VARAKRTDRAEARRRYRVSQTELQAEDLEADEETDAEKPTIDRPDAPNRRAGATPGRQRNQPAPTTDGPTPAGIGAAFRGAYRPANVREDIRELPRLLRSRAVWAPALVSIATAAIVVATAGNEPITRVLAQFFLVPPPIGAVFIAGFFAPRASYLAGAIVGLVGALGFIAVVASLSASLTAGLIPGASASPSAAASTAASASASASVAPSQSPVSSPSASGGSPAASPSAVASAGASPSASPEVGSTAPIDVGQAAGYWIALSVVSGSLFGAAAAWYRRFLRLSSARRAGAASSRQQRSARRR
jgi:hypothetical protein